MRNSVLTKVSAAVVVTAVTVVLLCHQSLALVVQDLKCLNQTELIALA